MTTSTPDVTKRAWTAMTLTLVGEVGDLVQMPGNGKSSVGSDPGDFLCPPGQDK